MHSLIVFSSFSSSRQARNSCSCLIYQSLMLFLRNNKLELFYLRPKSMGFYTLKCFLKSCIQKTLNLLTHVDIITISMKKKNLMWGSHFILWSNFPYSFTILMKRKKLFRGRSNFFVDPIFFGGVSNIVFGGGPTFLYF